MHLCYCELGWFFEFFCRDATVRAEITVLAKHTSKLARSSVMRVAYPLDDLLDRSTGYDRDCDLARRASSGVLAMPSAHSDLSHAHYMDVGVGKHWRRTRSVSQPSRLFLLPQRVPGHLEQEQKEEYYECPDEPYCGFVFHPPYMLSW